jgi:hypothetical protein
MDHKLQLITSTGPTSTYILGRDILLQTFIRHNSYAHLYTRHNKYAQFKSIYE